MCLRGTLFYHLMESTPLNHWRIFGSAVETWMVIHVQALPNGFQLHQPILDFYSYMTTDNTRTYCSDSAWNSHQDVGNIWTYSLEKSQCGLYAKFELALYESAVLSKLLICSRVTPPLTTLSEHSDIVTWCVQTFLYSLGNYYLLTMLRTYKLQYKSDST